MRSTRLSNNVARVLPIYQFKPWLSFDEAGDRNPEGLKITVYLIDVKSDRGVFGNGNIVVDMFALEPQPDGSTRRELAKQWKFGPEDAPRSREPSRIGMGYGLRLDWRPAEVLGKEIEIIVSFERHDGQIIRSQTKRFPVPQALETRN